MLKKILCISSLMLSLSACDALQAHTQSNSDSASAVAASQVIVPQKNLLEDRETLMLAQQGLQNLPYFSGKSVQVFGNIDFFDGVQPRIELSVQSPLNADDVWQFKYERGKWSKPIIDEEEDLNASQMARHLTPLQDIHFEDVTYAAQLWRTKANEVNAVLNEPYHVAFIWMPKLKRRFWHTAEIEAVGAQYYLSINTDGTVWEWKKL